NVAEAEDLTGLHIRDLDEMIHAANMLMTLGARTVILKGGAITGDTVYDVLVDGQGVEVYRNDRVPSRATHGAGTTLSAGLATGLAQGFPVREAFARARAFVNRAIAEAKIIGKGYGPLNHQIRPSETLPVFGEQE
ncbi:MAG TPA: PfkB family carbohydrate kinase, partial [Alphaproteobacteria bacterium]|nr:PfkB family carbohydrate kinase [Alphaproteobacteria bacterium]